MSVSEATEVIATDPLPRKLRTWPIVLFFLAMLGADFFLYFFAGTFFTYFGIPPLLIASLIYGIALGQACVLSTLGGLYGRCWLAGITTAAALATVAIATVLLGQNWMYDFQLYDALNGMWGAFTMPAIVLVAAAPFLLARVLVGWRLTRTPDDRTWREANGLEELFLVTAAIASLLFLCRLPLAVWEAAFTQFMLATTVSCGVLAGVSLLLGIPTAYLVFRMESRLRRWMSLAALFVLGSLVVSGALLVITNFWAPQTFSIQEAMIAGFSTLGLGGAILVWGLSALRLCGFQLVNKSGRRVAIEEAGDQHRLAGRNLHRRWVAGVFLIATAASLGQLQLTAWRRSTDAGNVALYHKLREQGGSIDVRGRDVIEIVFGPDTTDADIGDYVHLTAVEEISLANTKLTDSGLAQLRKFPKLRSLDVSHTNISTAGLVVLKGLKNLYHLSIADTHLSPDDLPGLLNSLNLSSLDVGHLGLDDDFLPHMHESRTIPGIVSLAGNEITDAGLEAYLSLPRVHVRELDLSDTTIDGSALAGGAVLHKLMLDNVPLTDATFGPVLKSLQIDNMLILRNTGLTNATLPLFAGAAGIAGLELGDGNFTEDALPSCGQIGMYTLALTGKQYTGECFRNWHPGISRLSMSGSSIKDDKLVHLLKLTALQRLDLSNTQITDAALPTLSKLSIYQLDLSNTQVTAQGLRSADLPNGIRVALGQFSVKQLHDLKQRMPIVVGRSDNEW